MASLADRGCKLQQLVGVVVLLSAVVHLSSSSSVQDCLVVGEKLRITDKGIGYFRTNTDKVQIKVHAKNAKECIRYYFIFGIIKPTDPGIVTYDIAVSELTTTNLTVFTSIGTRREPWYEISYARCSELLLKIGEKITPLPLNNSNFSAGGRTETSSLMKYNIGMVPSLRNIDCYPTHLDIFIKNAKVSCPWSLTGFKTFCSKVSSLPRLQVNKSVSRPSSSTPSFTQQTSFTNPLNMPSMADLPLSTTYHIEDNGTSDYGSRGEENAIPIFIGVLAFTLSMCMRFCLCRGKSVVQRVTTVTVIRSRPATEAHENEHDAARDPPPAYIDVVNENQSTLAPQEPPPPAYSDIDPPSYYDIEVPAGAEPEPELEPTAGQDRTQQAAPNDSGAPQEAPETVTSSFARAMQSKARAQLKQFSFKPLEEEGE